MSSWCRVSVGKRTLLPWASSCPLNPVSHEGQGGRMAAFHRRGHEEEESEAEEGESHIQLDYVSPSPHITTAHLPHPFSFTFSCIFVWGVEEKERLFSFSPFITFILFSSPSSFILCPSVNDGQVFCLSNIEEEYSQVSTEGIRVPPPQDSTSFLLWSSYTFEMLTKKNFQAPWRYSRRRPKWVKS